MGITLSAITTAVEAVLDTVIVGTTTVASVLESAALSVGLAALSSFLLKSSLGNQDQKQNIRQATGSRRRYYGQVKIGGVWAFLKAAEPRLYQVTMLCEGGQTGIDSFVAHYLGDDLVTLDGDGYVSNPTRYVQHDTKYAYIETKLGTDTQTAFGVLSSAFPGDWTSDHKLLGIACVLVVLLSPPANRFTEVYDAGLPQYNAVIRASKVWDPRDEEQDPDDPSTWTWTDNGVLVLMDYLWNQDGMRLPRSLIEAGIDVWKAEADFADELCDLKGGGSERRYRLSGGYNLTDPPKAVLPLMLQPMDAQLSMRGDGAIIVETGKFSDPDVTISDDHILSYSGFQTGRPKTDLRNEIHSKFVSPDYKYIEQEADPWINQASVDVDGTQAMEIDTMDWCPSHRQARVRMKIEAYRQCPDRSGVIITDAYGMNALKKRLVRFQITELGLNAICEIEKWSLDTKTGNVTFNVHTMPSEAWAWDPDVDEGTAPGVGTDPTVTPVADPPTQPTSLEASNDAGTVTISFIAPNDLRVAACRVWRGTTTTFADADDISDAIYCSPNQALAYEDTPGTGTWYYWATAENLVGDLSDETGPETVTI